jgi:hypothetical protein
MCREAVVKRWAVLCSVVLTLAIPWAAAAVALAARFPMTAGVWLFAPLVAGCAYAILLELLHQRELRRVHPAWPWRLRESKSTPAE